MTATCILFKNEKLFLSVFRALTALASLYLQSPNGTGRVLFSPTPELRLKISEDMSMFRTWTISPYCQHKLHLDPEKKEAPRWEGRKEHPLVRTHQNHQKWKKSFNEEKDRHRPGDTLCHFSPAGGTATALTAAILDSDPVCTFNTAYGDKYLYCSHIPILDIPLLAQLIALNYHQNKNRVQQEECWLWRTRRIFNDLIWLMTCLEVS